MTCVHCENLRFELERFRKVVTIDIQNLQTENLSLRRKLTTAERKLGQHNDADPDAGEVKDLLLLWKALCNKNARTYIGSDGKRWKLAKTALKRHGQERCAKALKGLSMKPYAGPRGRSAEAYPGSKRFDDIEHVFGDEERFERCEAYVDEPTEPAPVALPRVRVPRQTVWQQPIQIVLGALEAKGLRWKPGQADTWSAQCPAHDDDDPSLSIRETDEGYVLLHCFAGCPTDDVVEALGLGLFDLFPAGRRAA